MHTPLKIAHLSDLHFCMKYLEEVNRCTAFAVDRAIQDGVDLVVISGDATECGLDMHSPAAHALLALVRKLTDHCPVLMLQGTYSHEPPGTLNVFRHLGGAFPIYVADSIKQVAMVPSEGRMIWIESEKWRFDSVPNDALLIVSCLPSVNKGAVAAVTGAEAASEEIGRNVAAVLAGFGITNRGARALGIPTFGVSHGTVTGCLTEHGVPMAGMDHEFNTSSLFSAECSGFALGHIHRHQLWQQDHRVIAYPGSIGRLHYGEEGDKGFLIWHLEATGGKLDFISTPARRMIHVEFDGKPDVNQLRELARQSPGSFVRVRWQIAEEERGVIDRTAITAAMDGVAGIKLEETLIPMLRARLPELASAHSVSEKVALWARSTEVDENALSQRVVRLASETPDDIVNDILNRVEQESRNPLKPTSSAVEQSGLQVIESFETELHDDTTLALT